MGPGAFSGFNERTSLHHLKGKKRPIEQMMSLVAGSLQSQHVTDLSARETFLLEIWGLFALNIFETFCDDTSGAISETKSPLRWHLEALSRRR